MHVVNLLSVIALGFFLGMRHATDPDHVIAVTTIVARHRSIKHAALIGGLWGVGHTLTILAVGGAIIGSDRVGARVLVSVRPRRGEPRPSCSSRRPTA